MAVERLAGMIEGTDHKHRHKGRQKGFPEIFNLFLFLRQRSGKIQDKRQLRKIRRLNGKTQSRYGKPPCSLVQACPEEQGKYQQRYGQDQEELRKPREIFIGDEVDHVDDDDAYQKTRGMVHHIITGIPTLVFIGK